MFTFQAEPATLNFVLAVGYMEDLPTHPNRQEKTNMTLRAAESRWNGGLQSGHGEMKLGSGAFVGPSSFATRFGEEPGTNPEEWIGAALSGCFSMFLAGILSEAGHQPNSIMTRAQVHLGKIAGAPRITRIELDCQATVPGLSRELFNEEAAFAKQNCLISNALRATEVLLQTRLKPDLNDDA